MADPSEWILQLGERYTQEPSVAKELLRALVAHEDGGLLINQAWLDCNWDHPDAIEFLVEICDIYGMSPEPLREFMHVCWARDEPAWHHFLTLDMLEDDPELAEQIYDRFFEEGPSHSVIDSMMFLQGSLDSDSYAAAIMPDMINRGMLDNPCAGLLKLWRRYGVSDGLEQPALQALRSFFGQRKFANLAVRVVECLKLRDIRPMIGHIMLLACNGAGWDIATRRARRVIVDVSTGMYSTHVARAIRCHRWQDWMARVHHSCQWKLLDYMRDNRAMNPMIALMNVFPASALRHGVFTRIMQMDPDYFERADINHVAEEAFPQSVHTAVHYMYMQGRPPPAIALFYLALDLYPDAVHCIALRAPTVHREVTWARRRLLLCAMAKDNLARGSKSPKGPACKASVLKALAAHECVWPGVLQFL